MGEIITVTGSDYTGCTDRITGALKENKILIMPSDTIYGFLCTAACEQQVREIKQRDTKPFLYLIDSYSCLDKLDIDYSGYKEILEKNWPGPFTFILEKKDGTTLGIRMPDWDILRNIVAGVGEPLLSTSVNISGQDPLTSGSQIIESFLDQVDYVVADDDVAGGTSSTIIKLTNSGHTIIREGSGQFRT